MDLSQVGVVVAIAIALGIAAGLAWRIRDSERRYRLVLDRMPATAIAVFDRELRFRFAAGPALKQSGWHSPNVKGKKLGELFPATEADALAVHYRAALRGETRSFEYRSIHTGRDFWVRIAPLREVEGEVKEGLAVTIDVTDRERSARDLGHHAADFDAIAEATRALARSTDATSARIAVCEGARRVAEAPVAALFEPSPDGSGLTAKAAVGANLRGLHLPLSRDGSGAARAFGHAEEVFVTSGSRYGKVDKEFLDRTGAVAALWHPVVRDRAAIGVLAIAWREPLAGVSLRLSALIDLLGAEAAVAIGRADLLGTLEQMARTDDLTSLPNRRAWEQELPRELARAWREDRKLCVAMLDLDHFKDFNDREGHQAGDRLLEQAAGAWQSVLRPYDVLARYGGEEFAVILPSCALEDAMRLVERLRAVTPRGESCSAGIAEWDGDEQPETLVGRADAALYRAKRSGRDRTVAAPTIG